jgi:hypothetical protein
MRRQLTRLSRLPLPRQETCASEGENLDRRLAIVAGVAVAHHHLQICACRGKWFKELGENALACFQPRRARP